MNMTVDWAEFAVTAGLERCETAPRGHSRLTDTAEKDLRMRGSSSLWRPLRVSTFRNLLVAEVVPMSALSCRTLGLLG